MNMPIAIRKIRLRRRSRWAFFMNACSHSALQKCSFLEMAFPQFRQ